jgi:two-component system sensor histidine kinase BaeS
MFKSIRFRLALSYVGMVLFVALALGAVLLFTLRAYYSERENLYLQQNARVIGIQAGELLSGDYSPEVLKDQIQNLGFISQTRVRLYDAEERLLADTGPRGSMVIKMAVFTDTVDTAEGYVISEGAEGILQSSVIVVQKTDSGIGYEIQTEPVTEIITTDSAGNIMVEPRSSTDVRLADKEVITFSPIQAVSTAYGIKLDDGPDGSIDRSDQVVRQQVMDGSGNILGYVELSEGPAYGSEILASVRVGLIISSVFALLLSTLVGLWISKQISAPLVSLTNVTEQMSQGDLQARAADSGRSDELGTLGKAFNQMAGQMENTIDSLKHFISDAAHQIQTPITALRTNLELASAERDKSKRARYLDRAQEQAIRLQKLANELLDLSRMESASVPSKLQEVDLAALARQICEPYAAQAEQAGQKFTLDLPASLGPVAVDTNSIQQALGNLLDNALKFTPSGGQITLSGLEVEDEIRLWVEDDGIGIPAEDMEQLYSRFHRGRNAGSYPGNGLGLAIVQAIMKMHGGSVWAENLPDGGVRFTLVFYNRDSK